jgi:pSer/pThr/pTyr-binding forkhead associated (FHA) protein
MECPRCSAANPAGNRFCAECGSQLELAPPPVKPSAVGAVSVALRLTALLADGSEGGSFSVTDGSAVGRATGSIFAGDNYLSPAHAAFRQEGARVFVRDVGSLNGVYLRLRANTPWRLRWGDMFRVGQQILRLDPLEGPEQDQYRDGVRYYGSSTHGYVARLSLMVGRDTTGNAFLIPKAGFCLGRERGHALLAEDGYVSSMHCHLSVDADNAVLLTDLGSSNGSFVRLRQEHLISAGDILLMGQQLFRVDF